MPDPTTSIHCAITTRQYEAQLFGTAPRVDVWFLLEYPYPWGSHATNDNDLPPATLEAAKKQLENIPNSRLQFIKRDERQTHDNLMLYIALVDEQQPALYKVTLPSAHNLSQIDFAAFLNRAPSVEKHRTTKPVFLVCTNTRRDSCCARGWPIYEALRQHETVETWQVTHIGGHRYAATLIALPHSIYYGHVEAADVAAIVAAHNQGAVYLPKMRGRTCYDPVVQAAEYYLRSQAAQTTIEALQLEAVTSAPSDDEWLVSFRLAETGSATHDLRLTRQQAGYLLPKSCNKAPGPVYEYRLLETQNT